MPLKPEVNTSPYGALLLIAGIIAVALGAVVLPGLLYVAFWGLLVLLALLAAYYVGQRFHRRLLGGRRR